MRADRGPGVSLSQTAALGYLKIQVICLLVLERNEAALVRLDAMLGMDPRHHYALASRAQLLVRMARQPEAILATRYLVSIFRDDAAGWFNLGFLLDETGKLDEARSAFLRACKLQPGLDRAWYGLGLVCIKQRRLDEAVAALNRNVELQPLSPYGWYQLARLHVERQDPEKARLIISRLKGFEPKVAARLERETGLQGTQPS